ncbi:MAG: ArsC/Spx/MgsR family protein [Burkholderiaceae bacterium]|nr:ArsC/Spx/MgsR family protein [Burkholderiaceae bacterium]
MTHLVFFEKPGCAGNAKQRALLEAAGHTLERRNLLTAPWTPERLLEFLATLPVAQWFNRAAPRVKSGEIVPEQLDAASALALLLAEPLLIRRPLMQRTDDGKRLVGFDTTEVERFVGTGAGKLPASLEGCAAVAPRAACPTPN